jgi:hypothetical protein
MMNNRKLVFEIIEQVQKLKSRQDKITFLRNNNSGALQDLLRGTYDDRIVWLLPKDETPPYTPSNPESTPSNLLKETVKLKYLVKGAGYDDMLQWKREKLFIGLIESIHPNDALLMINMINKKPIKGLTKKLIEEAFPNLLS